MKLVQIYILITNLKIDKKRILPIIKMGSCKEYWFITIIIAIILLIIAVIAYWLSTSTTISAWIWATLILSFILTILSLILFAARSSFEKKYVIQPTLMVEPVWSDSCHSEMSDCQTSYYDLSPRRSEQQQQQQQQQQPCTSSFSTQVHCRPPPQPVIVEMVQPCPPPPQVIIQPCPQPCPPPVIVEMVQPCPPPPPVIVDVSKQIISETPCETTYIETTKLRPIETPISKPKIECKVSLNRPDFNNQSGVDSLYPKEYR